MSFLEQVKTGIQCGPRRAMIVGVHGVGKSTWAAQADSPIFMPTEDGLADVDCTSLPLMKSLDDVKAAIRELYREEHGFKTLVVDSVDWLERLIWDVICLDKGVKDISEIGFGVGYSLALAEWAKMLEGFSRLRDDKGMAIVLIAHAKIERFHDPTSDSYDRYSPKLHKGASALCQEWCDEVLFANYRVFTKEKEEGFNKKRTIGIGSGERVLYTTDRPAHIAKNRLGLPDEIPMTWDAYASHFPKEGE